MQQISRIQLMIKEFLVSDEIRPTRHIAPDLQIRIYGFQRDLV